MSVNTNAMSYNKVTKTLTVPLSATGFSSFPKDLPVESAHTGRTVLYCFDEQAAIAADFWDGEEAHYFCASNTVNAAKLVIFANQQ